MPRVLRILNRLIIGGPSLNAVNLTKHMSAAGFDTLLVTGDKDDHEQDAGHLIGSLEMEPVVIREMKREINIAADRAAYLKMKALIREFKPDIVHTHAAKSGAIGRLAADACKVPVIVHTFHGHVFHSYFNKLKTQAFIRIERYLARRSSGIIAISELQKEELAHVYKICPPEKINIIPLGFDLEKFSTNQHSKRQAFRAKYQIEEDEIAIGIIGRIVPVKNHGLFVAAAARVRAQAGGKVRFLIIGDGDMRGQMESEWQAAGIDYAYYPENTSRATAICTSWQTEMDEVVAGLDIITLTSHNEGTPVSLIEAQAAGKPVVSTRVGGVADVILDGENGFITERGDADALADALIRLVRQPELQRSFGENGQKHVVKKYSCQRLVSDMSAYYEHLLSQSRNKK